MQQTVYVKKPHPEAILPRYGSAYAAGADLCACLTQSCVIAPGQTVLVPTGLAMALPKGYGGFVFARSGLGIRHGVVPGNCVGVIDSDYRGEILVGLQNSGDADYVIQPADRIAQLMVVPVVQAQVKMVDQLDETQRGAGGFGSTGK